MRRLSEKVVEQIEERIFEDTEEEVLVEVTIVSTSFYKVTYLLKTEETELIRYYRLHLIDVTINKDLTIIDQMSKSIIKHIIER